MPGKLEVRLSNYGTRCSVRQARRSGLSAGARVIGFPRIGLVNYLVHNGPRQAKPKAFSIPSSHDPVETHPDRRSCARTALNDPKVKPARIVDAEGHRENILDVATQEFATHGFAGTRVDEIAAKTSCSKRMIYYYFADKDGLYIAVLENAYRRVRQLEEAVDYDMLSPIAALRKLVAFRFSYHEKNAHFVKLVLNENRNGAHHLARSDVIVRLNQVALATVDGIYARGVHERVFRPGISALEIHWQISAFCFYSVSNRATFSTLFEQQISIGLSFEKIKANAIDSIMRFVIP